MNRTAIKNFAIWARNKLLSDISYRASLMGISESGIAKPLPQSTGMTEFYDIGSAEPYSISGHQLEQRFQLVEAIRCKEQETDYKTAYHYIIEEVAYTWFNRLIAIRFMEVNDYLPSHIRVLSSETGKLEPDLVSDPFDADLSFTAQEETALIQMKRENRLDEAFRMLFIRQCNALNEILPALFEVTGHYTELLLNLSVIDQDGVVWHLVHDIDEADFDVERGGQVEIIGWLYQYYNTEPKDETFALMKKNVKITKERIPSATQLFTPDWIVRYMVENSLGRLWLEGHPDDGLKSGWKYYLDEADQESDLQIQLEEIRRGHRSLTPRDIRVIDPCMGSGHILVCAFDVLMQIYESQGYLPKDAARSIVKNNLYGLDIDQRAAQLAYFAVMMKARSYDRRFLTRKDENGDPDIPQPCIYAIVESNGLSGLWTKDNLEMQALFDAMRDAKEYGSLLTVPTLHFDRLRQFARSKVESIDQFDLENRDLQEQLPQVLALIDVAEVLSGQYQIVSTNPPYAGFKGLNADLRNYLNSNYVSAKGDLFTAFILRCIAFSIPEYYFALITPGTLLYNPSYEKLRKQLCASIDIVNLVELGDAAFDGGFGTAMYVGRNYNIHCNSTYIDASELEEKELFFHLPRHISSMKYFEEFHSCKFMYKLNEDYRRIVNNATKLSEYGSPRIGLQTNDNDRFVRIWHEVEYNKFCSCHLPTDTSFDQTWYPMVKGGGYRKWYGNIESVVNWKDNGREIKNLNAGAAGGRIVAEEFYFQEGLTWTHTTYSQPFSMRYMPAGVIINIEGPAVFHAADKQKWLLGCLNSCVADDVFKKVVSSIHYSASEIGSYPIIYADNSSIDILVDENVFLARTDWDAFETSWDFKRHPLARQGATLAAAFEAWKDECSSRFIRLKANEEELNRIFIDIYGLQDELTPEVEDRNVTVRLADKSRDVKSLLSYAVGCMFGRYSLDVDGLAYAGGDWDAGKYSSFIPDADNVIPITDEEYLEDDILSRLCQWLKVVYGEETLEPNLDFIAQALGNKGDTSREVIRNYFLKDFYADHCKVYQKRPVYWLFDSGKQNGFKALIYLHRYNVDTIGNLRIDYLHRMQRIYESEINRMQDVIDHSENIREVAQAAKRREKLQKQFKECREYDGKLSHLALSRIELDLDDGVKANYEKVQTARDGKKYAVLAK